MSSGHKMSDAEQLLPVEPQLDALEAGLEPRARRVPLGLGSSPRLWVPAALLAAATGAVVLHPNWAEPLKPTQTAPPSAPTAPPSAPTVSPSEPPEVTLEEVSPSPMPTQIMLRSVNGRFVAAERDGVLVANRPWADDWEKFGVLNLGEGAIALKSFHGPFVGVDATGGLSATAPTWAADGAKFQVTFADDGRLELKSSLGKYVSADLDGTMHADEKRLTENSEFELFHVADTWPAHVAVKTLHGKYLRGKAGGGVAADGLWPLDNWKRLQVTRHADGKLSLKFDHGEYLSVRPDSSVHSSKELATSEKFTVTHLDDGKFTLTDHKGRFVCASSSGSLTLECANSGDASEKLEVVFLP